MHSDYDDEHSQPPRKRQRRMSLPSSDDYLEDISTLDFTVLDEMEADFSQKLQRSRLLPTSSPGRVENANDDNCAQRTSQVGAMDKSGSRCSDEVIEGGILDGNDGVQHSSIPHKAQFPAFVSIASLAAHPPSRHPSPTTSDGHEDAHIVTSLPKRDGLGVSEERDVIPSVRASAGVRIGQNTSLNIGEGVEDNPFSSSPAVDSGLDMETWFQSGTRPAPLTFTSAKHVDLLDFSLGDPGANTSADFHDTTFPDADEAANVSVVSLGFTSAKLVNVSDPMPQSQDDGLSSTVDFTSATFTAASALTAGSQEDNASSLPIGFTSAKSGSNMYALSSEALRKHQEKLKLWHAEVDDLLEENEGREPDNPRSCTSKPGSPSAALTFSTPKRKVLHPLDNAFDSPGHPPETPTPAGGTFARPSMTDQFKKSAGIGEGKTKPFKSPLAFKSPLVKAPPSAGPGPVYPSTRINSVLRPTSRPTPSSKSGGLATPATPVRPDAFPAPNMITPVRPLGATPVRATPASASTSARPKFVTPFKPGLRPGEPGRLQLERQQTERKQTVNDPTRHAPSGQLVNEVRKTADTWKARQSAIAPKRKTLAQSCLVPQSYTADELESLGVNVAELRRITPETALRHVFHTATPKALGPSTSESTPTSTLGASAALHYLQDKGCWLATKEWVVNHWGLILWKLAGMACIEPDLELDPDKKRWCWREVLKQLTYRYERELNRGSRPPLRLITTRDARPSFPMVLCVSGINFVRVGLTEDGETIRKPELEVTDGWYRLRAEVDEPLERAINKGLIKVGRKVGVSGARLISERKEPMEVLEAYNSCHLALTGNSCHLAPWHAKLGFQRDPFVATLGSLTSDGGLVPLVDIIIKKVYPLAFIEFIENDRGTKSVEGPRNEKEEAKEQARWQKRRDTEESKLRDKFAKRFDLFERQIESLERRAAGFRTSEDDAPPAGVEDILDEMEETNEWQALTRNLSKDKCAWLAKLSQEKVMKLRERFRDDIEEELKDICPPRNVSGFRVLQTEDARTNRKPGNRQLQLTVWDVLGLCFGEGEKFGTFKEGQRFLVSNLYPNDRSAWMGNESGAMIYMATRKDTRWTRIN